MAMKPNTRRVKAGITAAGYLTAVKDYKEPAVVEELAANSYDADASTVLIILDSNNQRLHIVDDGAGFSKQAIEYAAFIGGGEKREVEYSTSKRPYLGAYGFGLKSTLNIATSVEVISRSNEGCFRLSVDWRKLDQALHSEADGFELIEHYKGPAGYGTHITLQLKNPTSSILEHYHRVLSNLPTDGGKCLYYTGQYTAVKHAINFSKLDFSKLKSIARSLTKQKALQVSEPSSDPDLGKCRKIDFTDRQDTSVKGVIYFSGYENGKVKPLKKGLRGIYVRIQGRLLKQSFDDQKYVYSISKWVKFAAGLRVELSIDWLRNEISLSREGLTFSNRKLEEEFRSTISRNISAFIAPELKALEKKNTRGLTKKHNQRIELARRRIAAKANGKIPSITHSFNFKPETDGELALVIANKSVVKKINKDFELIDYNDQAAFDCILYNRQRREFVFAELEPTLTEFLHHKTVPIDMSYVITWSLGKWRIGARHKGVAAHYELQADGKKKGTYKLLAFRKSSSKSPFADYTVSVIEELL